MTILIKRWEKFTDNRIMRIFLAPIVLFSLFRVVLDLSYRFLLSPLYGYMGFTYSFNLTRWLGILFISILTYYAVSAPNKTISSLFFELLLWFMYGPYASYYSLSGNETTFFFYLTICLVIMRLMLSLPWRLLISKVLRPFSFLKSWVHRNQVVLRRLFFWGPVLFCLAWTATSIVILIKYTDFSNWRSALDVLRVYEIRSLQSRPSWTTYFLSTQSSIINIFMVCTLIYRKKYLPISFFIVTQLLFYFSLGNKSDLMAPIMCIFVYFVGITQKPSSLVGVVMTVGTFSVTMFAFISSYGSTLYSLFRRMFFVQAQLSYNYFSFFTTHNKLFFSEGRLGRLFHTVYPYPIRSGRLIFGNSLGSVNGSANCMFLTSGFADMGFPGMVLTTLVLCFILIVLDRTTAHQPLWFPITVLSLSFVSLINTNLFTALGTHGMLIAIVLLTSFGAYFRLMKYKEAG